MMFYEFQRFSHYGIFWRPAVVAILCILTAANPVNAQSALDRYGFGRGAKSETTLPAHPARASLVADVASIKPGVEFRIGVRVQMEPHWHIYWRNSGDSGLPTSVSLTLPPGFSASELQWPAPTRFVTESETTYGYADEVVLFWRVKAPADAGPGPFKFSASADWLVCSVECIPGEAEPNLTLPGGDGAQSTDADLIAAQAGTVPVEPARLAYTLSPQSPLVVKPGESQLLKIKIAADQLDPSLLANNRAQYGLFVVFPDDFEATHADWMADVEGWIISLPVKPRQQAAPGQRLLEAVLAAPLEAGNGSVQAFTLRLPIVVEAAPASTPSAASGPASTPKAAPPAKSTGAPLDFVKSAPAQSAGGLWLYLVYAFFGGLILNIMPCVLPVISLKVMGFVRQAGESPARVRLLGLVYAGGVLASFLVMAAVAIGIQAGGSQAAWGTQMQNPRFVLLLIAVVFCFALSLLGVFTLEPPQSVGKLAGAAPREGAMGAFMSGVLTTALATPCTAPFLGPAMAFALGQPPLVIILFFAVVALGLAAPYVLLAFQPHWLKWMPKPGAWMETCKQLMGFVLLATVLWLVFTLAGLVAQNVLLWTLAFLLVLGLACWCLGRGLDPFRKLTARRLNLALAVVLAVLGYLFLIEQPLRADEAAQVEVAVDPVGAKAVTHGGITWEPFSPQKVEELVAANRTVFLDFTADWCVTCKVNENGVLAGRETAELFAKHNVAAVRGDWTRRDDTIARVLKQFNRSGVPLYVVFPAGKADQPIVLPTLLTRGLLEEAFNAGGQVVPAN